MEFHSAETAVVTGEWERELDPEVYKMDLEVQKLKPGIRKLDPGLQNLDPGAGTAVPAPDRTGVRFLTPATKRRILELAVGETVRRILTFGDNNSLSCRYILFRSNSLMETFRKIGLYVKR